MKPTLTLVAMLSLAFVQPAKASAFLTYLDPIRAEIVNQQVILSNAPPVDKKLATALKNALKAIDKPTTTSLVNDTKALSSVVSTLSKTTLSNQFSGLLDGGISNYLAVLVEAADTGSDALDLTFPGGLHNAAQKTLDKILASLNAAETNINLSAAARALNSAALKFGSLASQILKAENAKPPKASITANVTGALSISGLKTLGAAVSQTAPNNFVIVGIQGTLHARIVNFVLYGVPEGNSTINIDEALFTDFTRPFSKNPHGSATVTRNSATKSIFGSFTYTVEDDNNAAATVTVTGTFFGTYL